VLYLYVLIFLALPLSAWAQVPLSIRSGEATLSLGAAIDEAMTANPTLVALRRQFEAARLRPAQERFLMPPTFEAQIWQWPINTLNPLNTHFYMFTLNQELPGRGKRDLRAAVAEKDAEIASNDIAVRARDVIAQIKRAYADLYVNRKAIEVHQGSVDLLRQFADASVIKYSAGQSSQQDVLKAVVEVSKLHEELGMFEEGAQLAAAQLNTLLNRLPGAPVGPLEEPAETRLLPTAEDLQSRAFRAYPGLRGAELAIERAQASLAAIERDYKPDFTVGGGYMLMPSDHDAWTASIGITWPTARWARGRLDGQKAEATAAIEASRAEQQVMESEVLLAVQQAYIRVKSAEQRAALLRTSVLPQSRQTLEVSRVAYQANRGDLLALIENQRMVLDSQLAYFRALSDLEQARAELEGALGEDLAPDMTLPVDGSR
jgi:outer membrane protein, heavy metal efflux system